MNEEFKKIISRFEKFTELNNSERNELQNELLDFAIKHKELFISQVQMIEPSESSVLFEIYEALSKKPDLWIDFIVTEFNRIRIAVENAKSKDKKSISSPLTAISFFVRKDYSGINKLLNEINSGLYSKSNQVVKICLDLLSDLYLVDKLKYKNIREQIEKFKNHKNSDLNKYARSLIRDFDNPVKIKKSIGWYAVYAFFVFLIGLLVTIETIFLYEKTFIRFGFVVMIFSAGLLISWLFHSKLTKNASIKISEKIEVLIGYGLFSCFLFLLLNFSFVGENTKNEVYMISRKGFLPKGRHGHCEIPFIEFKRGKTVKKIKYKCDYESEVEKADSVSIFTKRGLFNFDIVEKQELINHGG